MRKRAPGGAVILAGPDGTGKSSIVTWSRKEVAPQPLTYMWQRPAVLPRRSPEGVGDHTKPHQAPRYGAVVSWMKLLYVLVDYQLGWLIRIRPFSRKGGITMIDRGWWDMAVDPTRYRLAVPSRAIEILGRLVPKPDLVVILDAPPEVILQRKQDLPADEIVRQNERWRHVLPPRVPHITVDASRSMEEVAHAVRDAMRARGIVA